MTLVFDIIFASIAAILSILSLKTLADIKHLGVGKIFWIPIFASSLVFVIGSAMTILYEMSYFVDVAYFLETAEVTRILALCILFVGIYNYSKKIKGSLREEFTIPDQLIKERLNIEAYDESNLESEPPVQEQRTKEEKHEKAPQEETVEECGHSLGYLQTLPKNASIPDECLACDRIIECRHSIKKTLENQADTA